MSLFTAALLVSAALIAAGVAGMIRRRSLIGTAVAFEVAMAGGILLAVTLLSLTGVDSSLALVAVVVGLALATGAAVLVAAVHLAKARAAATERLEPW